MRGKLFVVSGPSGVGKNTLLNAVVARSVHVRYSISATSRAMRPGEVDGKSYYFVTREQFEKLIADDALLEYAEYVGNYYGTPLQPVRDRLALGKDMLFDIDVQGAAQLSLSLPEARFVFILPPSMDELERRLRGRGTDSEEAIRIRLSNARTEIMSSHWFDAIIVNDDLEKAYDQLRSFYLASTLQPSLKPQLARSICGA